MKKTHPSSFAANRADISPDKNLTCVENIPSGSTPCWQNRTCGCRVLFTRDDFMLTVFARYATSRVMEGRMGWRMIRGPSDRWMGVVHTAISFRPDTLAYITFTRIFEPRHNILSNVHTNVRKYVVTRLEHSRESDRRYPAHSWRSAPAADWDKTFAFLSSGRCHFLKRSPFDIENANHISSWSLIGWLV